MHDELAPMLAKVSEELAGQRDEALTTARTCQLAVEVVDSCDHATLALRTRGRLRTVAASSELAHRVDRRQYDLGEGPILATTEDAEVCRTGDVAADGRWPRWAAEAA